MGKLTLFLFSSLLILLLASSAMAAQVTIVFDEPTAAGNDCKDLRVYYCYGRNCKTQSVAARFPASSPSCGQLDRPLVFPLDVPQSKVGQFACFRVTVVNTAGNESAGDTMCVTVTSP